MERSSCISCEGGTSIKTPTIEMEKKKQEESLDQMLSRHKYLLFCFFFFPFFIDRLDIGFCFIFYCRLRFFFFFRFYWVLMLYFVMSIYSFNMNGYDCLFEDSVLNPQELRCKTPNEFFFIFSVSVYVATEKTMKIISVLTLLLTHPCC